MTAHRPLGRVLFFDDRHYAAQGAQRVLTQVAGFAAEAGYEVTVASTRAGAFLELAEARGLKTHVLGTPPELDQWGGLLSRRGASRPRLILALAKQNLRVARFVRRERYDVVWAAAMRPMLSLIATSAFGRAKVVWHVMSDAYYPGFNELAGMCADRIVLLADSLRPATGRLAKTRWITRRLRTVPPGIPAEAVTECQSIREVVARQVGLPPATLRKTWVASIGAFIPQKGHLDVVNAVNSLPEHLQKQVVVLLGGPAGEDEYRADVEHAAAASHADVTVCGWVEDPSAWMRASDVFVLASRREGVPLVVIEAMQRGAVPVAYQVGATPELIQHGRTGMLVDQGSVEDLAKALALVVGDPGRRAAMASAATSFVEERHTTAAMKRAFNQVLAEFVTKDALK